MYMEMSCITINGELQKKKKKKKMDLQYYVISNLSHYVMFKHSNIFSHNLPHHFTTAWIHH
jgi:hypothetical protein